MASPASLVAKALSTAGALVYYVPRAIKIWKAFKAGVDKIDELINYLAQKYPGMIISPSDPGKAKTYPDGPDRASGEALELCAQTLQLYGIGTFHDVEPYRLKTWSPSDLRELIKWIKARPDPSVGEEGWTTIAAIAIMSNLLTNMLKNVYIWGKEKQAKGSFSALSVEDQRILSTYNLADDQMESKELDFFDDPSQLGEGGVPDLDAFVVANAKPQAAATPSAAAPTTVVVTPPSSTAPLAPYGQPTGGLGGAPLTAAPLAPPPQGDGSSVANLGSNAGGVDPSAFTDDLADVIVEFSDAFRVPAGRVPAMIRATRKIAGIPEENVADLVMLAEKL